MEMVNEVVMKPIGEVTPYDKNPRKNDRTVDLLVEIIPKVGFNVPIVIDENGVIVKGHARYAAALRLGMESVPCVVTHADPEAVKADRIADNKIQEFSQWVNEELMHEVDMLNIDLDFAALDLPIPSMDDVDFDFKEEAEDGEMSQEELERKFAEFMANQEETEVQFVTPQQIEVAKMEQKETPAKLPNYIEVVCENCGHVMYVREGDERVFGE